MSELFLEIVNRSIAASWIVIAVLILRFCLKKAPKWVNVLLWGIVAVRLIFPFSIESALSLIPSAETVSPSIMMETAAFRSNGVPALDQVINPVIDHSLSPAPARAPIRCRYGSRSWRRSGSPEPPRFSFIPP